MGSQLLLFDEPEKRRTFLRLANGKFCTILQRKKDDEERTIAAVMNENRMLRRQVISQDKLIQTLLKDIQNEKTRQSAQ